MNEQAPMQQLPIGITGKQDYSANFIEVIPAQAQMDKVTCSRLDPKHQSANILRQRRPQGGLWQKSTLESSSENEEVLESKSLQQSDREADRSRDMADELLRQLQAGSEAQWSVLSQFQHSAFSSQSSSRAAQLALKDASGNHAALLASSLQGHVRRASQSKHANYVMQKIVEVMPMARTGFIVEELLGVAHETACHRFGCRLLCRILEHLSPGDEATLDLLDELLLNVEELLSHTFGSYVVRHILEFGMPAHKHRIASALLPQAAWYAKHRLASHVVEAALRTCSSDDQHALAETLLTGQHIAVLATNQFGRHVVRALLQLPGALKEETEHAVRQVEDQIRYSRFGKNILQMLP
jgi:hypothetical protein